MRNSHFLVPIETVGQAESIFSRVDEKKIAQKFRRQKQ